MTQEPMPPLPVHLASEFMLWLWWISDVNGSVYNFSTPNPSDDEPDDGEDDEDEESSVSLNESEMESIELWLDDRISMRIPEDYRPSNVMTGETVSRAPEAKVAILGGKVVHEIRMGFRCDDREYSVGLKGPELMLHGVKFPSVIEEDNDSTVCERMYLVEELEKALQSLFRDFVEVRTSNTWKKTASKIQEWLEE